MRWLLTFVIGGGVIVAFNYALVILIAAPDIFSESLNAPWIRRVYHALFENTVMVWATIIWFFLLVGLLLATGAPGPLGAGPLYSWVNGPLTWWGEHSPVPGLPHATALYHLWVLWFHYDLTMLVMEALWGLAWMMPAVLEHALRPPKPPQDATPQASAVFQARHRMMPNVISLAMYRARRARAPAKEGER